MTTSAEPPRPGMSRRKLATGAAWSVPAVLVASAAPAYAASMPCSSLTRYTVTWAPAGTVQSASNELITPTGSGQNLTTLTYAYTGTITDGLAATAPNRRTASFGGTTWITLNQASYGTAPQAQAAFQTVTFDFAAPLYCASFSIADVDGSTTGQGNFRDKVTVSGFTASTLSPFITTTGGTAEGTSGNTFPNGDPNGIALFSAAGPISSFSITYSNPIATAASSTSKTNNQSVFIGPISFYTSACTCGT